jgi:hypothetical protein
MYEDAYILRGQSLSIRVGNKMEPCSCTRRKERVPETWQWLAIEVPVLLLGYGKFALLFLSILGPQHPILEHSAGPDTGKACEAETEFEPKPC